MSLSVIPLTILGQITGVSGSGDTVLYQVSFKSIDGTPLYGVTAVWTDEQAEIEALAAQKPYGVWINPIDGTFTVKFAGYTYVGSADLTDSDVLSGITPIEFISTDVSEKLLPDVTTEDNGKILQVENGEWQVKDADYTRETVFFSRGSTVVDLGGGTYGFDLGQIEGLDSSVKTVKLTIANTSESNTYTLAYDETSSDPAWSDSDNTLSYLDADDSFNLQVDGIGESELGDVYSITLLTESIEPNFKAAVEEVAGTVIYESDSAITLSVTNAIITLAPTAISTNTALTKYIELSNPDVIANIRSMIDSCYLNPYKRHILSVGLNGANNYLTITFVSSYYIETTLAIYSRNVSSTGKGIEYRIGMDNGGVLVYVAPTTESN